MIFDRLFTSPNTTAARQNLKVFGVAAEYYPLAGGKIDIAADGSSFMVWFRKNVRLQVEGYEGLTTLDAKTIQVIAEDLQSVDYEGYFLVNGTQYQIVDKIEDSVERITFQVK